MTKRAAEELIAATRLADAQAMCQACAETGKPERNNGDAPHFKGGYASGPFVHRVSAHEFVDCFANKIWALDLS